MDIFKSNLPFYTRVSSWSHGRVNSCLIQNSYTVVLRFLFMS